MRLPLLSPWTRPFSSTRLLATTFFLACTPLFPIPHPLHPAIAQEINEPYQAEDQLISNPEANRFYQNGEQLLHEGQYQAAIEQLQQAFAIYKAMGDRPNIGRTSYQLGQVYRALGQPHQALEAYGEALAIQQAMGDRQAVSTTLLDIGLVYDQMGQYQAALNVFQQALFIRQEMGDRLGERMILGATGVTYFHLGEYEQALAFYQQALALHREVGDRVNEAMQLNAIGAAYGRLDQYQRALDTYLEARTVLQAIHHPAVEAANLNNIAAAYNALGQDEQALEFYQHALMIVQEIGRRNWEGEILSNLGSTYDNLGQDDLALEIYQQALLIQRSIGDRDGERLALSQIGELLAQQGHLELAITFLKQSVNVTEAIRQDIQGLSQDLQQAYTRKVADTYRHLADLLLQQDRVLEAQQVLDLLKVQELDDYLNDVRGNEKTAQGIDLWEAEQQIFNRFTQFLEIGINLSKGETMSVVSNEKISPEERGAEAAQLFREGMEYFLGSEFEAAIDSLQQALSIYRETEVVTTFPQESRQGENLCLVLLGRAYIATGHYQQGIEYYQQALTLAETRDDLALAGVSRTGIGLMYAVLGQYSQARELLQQALVNLREAGDHAEEAITLTHLAAVYSNEHQDAQALELLQQALPIHQEVSNHYGEIAALNAMGEIYIRQRQAEQALSSLQQALDISRGIPFRAGEGVVLTLMGEAYLSQQQFSLALETDQQALKIHLETGSRSGEAVTLSGIGRALLEQNQPELAITFLKQSVNVNEAIRQDILGLPQNLQQSYTETIADTYRRLADLLLQQDRVLEAQQVLDLLKVQELDDYLNDVRGNEQTAHGVDLWAAEQQISERFDHSLLDRNPDLDSPSPSFNDFLNDPEVQRLIEQLRRTARGQNLNPEVLIDLQDNLQNLPNAALLYPFVLDDRLELVLVPSQGDPIRRTVPVTREDLNRAIAQFRTLLTNRNSDSRPQAQQLYQWLIEPIAADLEQAGVETIIYATDGQLRYIPLAALHDGEQWLIQRFRINYITAASLTDFSTPSPPAEGLHVLAAAFSDTEQTYVIEVNDHQFRFSGLEFAGVEVENIAAAIPSTTELLNQDFSRATVEAQMGNYSIVHLATHAEFISGLPEESFIVFGNGDRVTLRDIANWSLPNVDLIVLSACKTAVGGALGNGEEILGFGYQIQRTGARAAIASLWSVDDGGTQVLMNTFYAALEQGMSEAEALRQAQITLITADFTPFGVDVSPQLQRYLDRPYYWAPFILIGNGL